MLGVFITFLISFLQNKTFRSPGSGYYSAILCCYSTVWMSSSYPENISHFCRRSQRPMNSILVGRDVIIHVAMFTVICNFSCIEHAILFLLIPLHQIVCKMSRIHFYLPLQRKLLQNKRIQIQTRFPNFPIHMIV